MSKGLKVFDKVGDGLKVNFDGRPTKEYIKYLNNYDTSNADTAYENLGDWASRASANLSNMGDYNFNVDASQEAQKRIENETFKNYLGKILPSYERQIDDLQTRLLNQGIGVDTAAYRHAMGGLQSAQNSANYINQLISALVGNLSSYDVANEKYNVGNALSENKAKAQNNSLQNKLSALKIAVDGVSGLAKSR